MNELKIRVSRRQVFRAGALSLLAIAPHVSAGSRSLPDLSAFLAQDGAAPTGGTFQSWSPFLEPPIGHFNTFVADGMLMGIFQGLFEMPLMHYTWATKEFEPLVATSWELTPENSIRIALREGAVWSDGSTLSADDVITTFTIMRAQNHPAWQYLGEVRAIDPLNVEFTMTTPSSVVPYYVLKAYLHAHSSYGAWAARFQEVFDTLGEPGTPIPVDEQVTALTPILEEFNAHKLEQMVSIGPYNFDTSTISSSQLTLTKVPTSFLADVANFDEIVLYNTTDASTVPTLVLSGNIDYSLSGFPPATEAAMIGAGLRVIRPSTMGGPALYFCYPRVPMFADARVRQAVARAIDRKENGLVSLAESGQPQKYMCGVVDQIIEQWLDAETLAALDPYATDVPAATATFEELGFTKDGDVWVSPDGERLEFELIVPAEYSDWAAAAINLADQLTAFGIKTTVRTSTAPQWSKDLREGNFELAIGLWGTGQPHPSFSYRVDLFDNNYPVHSETKGIDFPLQQTSEKLGAIDFEQLVLDSTEGFDEASQAEAIGKLAVGFNELLPIIPLWDRLANDMILEDKRVTGWPEDGDPLFANSVFSDNFVIQWILDGTLKGVV